MTHQTPAVRMMAAFVLVLAGTSCPATEIHAQRAGGPLTFQGLHQQHNPSAVSRALGSVTLGRDGDVGLMFANPSAMHGLDGIRVSVAGARQFQDLDQVQQFAPVRYYPNLSLLLEGMTDGIPDPDPDLIGFTPGDSVQRPFDDIPPNWSHSNNGSAPLHALVAAPFALGGMQLIAGAGFVRYANLDHYYQNNNVLDPDVLSQRPLPTLRPTDDNPLSVNWYQSVSSREGSMNGYGLSLAGHVERYGLTIGLSGLLLRGETDDSERLVQRGTLTFLANEFRADSTSGTITRIGTSSFSGQEFTLSSTLRGRYVSLGLVLRPPTRITRTADLSVSGDTAGTPIAVTESVEDRFQLPWRGSVGLLLTPRDDLSIGLEYEMRPYGSATFTDAAGVEHSPWESASLFRIGAEFALSEWLLLRGGIRGDAEVFIPDGSALEEPVAYRVFSAGFGVRFSGFAWNVAYERGNVRYEDIWGSSVSRNGAQLSALVTDVSFTIPFGR